MSIPMFTEIMPGLIVDIFRYEDNPSLVPEFEGLYYDGYWEIVVTVTRDNLCVPPQIKKALLVVPKSVDTLPVTEDDEYTVFALDQDDSISGISSGFGQIPTPTGFPDADMVYISIDAEVKDYKLVVLGLEHEDSFNIPEVMQCN